MRYQEVTKQELATLRPALSLIERVVPSLSLPDLYLYGLTSYKAALMDAREALVSQFDEELEDAERRAVTEPSQIAVCIPLSSDILYYLIGSGLKLTDETFAYQTDKDGVRTRSFEGQSGVPTRITDDAFTAMALSDSDSWVDDFLAEYGTKQEAAPSGSLPESEVPKAPPPTSQNAIDQYLNT